MSFWSTQKIRIKQREHGIIQPFDCNRIQQGSYELHLSRDISTTPNGSCPEIAEDGTFRLEAGQFALLYTHENLNIPNDTLAFISIKAKIKFKGLVNISGFHVDPGYKGKLKFSVYNASNKDVFLQCGKPTFLIWFANFEEATERPYSGSGLRNITLEDRQEMLGQSFSPAALNARLINIEKHFQTALWVIGIVIIPLFITIVGCCVAKLLEDKPAPQHSQPVSTMVISPVQNITPQKVDFLSTKEPSLKDANSRNEKVDLVAPYETEPTSPD